jgi:hypothetical protein
MCAHVRGLSAPRATAKTMSQILCVLANETVSHLLDIALLLSSAVLQGTKALCLPLPLLVPVALSLSFVAWLLRLVYG